MRLQSANAHFNLLKDQISSTIKSNDEHIKILNTQKTVGKKTLEEEMKLDQQLKGQIQEELSEMNQ